MFNLHGELKAYRLTKNYNKYLLKYNSDLAVFIYSYRSNIRSFYS